MLHEKYKNSYKIYGGLPNVCPFSPDSAQCCSRSNLQFLPICSLLQGKFFNNYRITQDFRTCSLFYPVWCCSLQRFNLVERSGFRFIVFNYVLVFKLSLDDKLSKRSNVHCAGCCDVMGKCAEYENCTDR